MPATVVADLPSGLSVTLREFKVSDEDLLADPQSSRRGTAVPDLLDAVTLSVDDPGPYRLVHDPKRGEERLPWSEVLQGDISAALLINRIHTWGHEYVARETCPKDPERCEPVEVELDLREFPIQKLPETSLRHVTANEPLTVVLPRAGNRVSFRLLRGKDDRGLAKLRKQKKDAASSSYLRFRVTDISDVPAHEWAAWLADLGGFDASFLRKAFDEADCGVEQEIEFHCQTCHHAWIKDARLDNDFLFPKHRGTTGIGRS